MLTLKLVMLIQPIININRIFLASRNAIIDYELKYSRPLFTAFLCHLTSNSERAVSLHMYLLIGRNLLVAVFFFQDLQ